MQNKPDSDAHLLSTLIAKRRAALINYGNKKIDRELLLYADNLFLFFCLGSAMLVDATVAETIEEIPYRIPKRLKKTPNLEGAVKEFQRVYPELKKIFGLDWHSNMARRMKIVEDCRITDKVQVAYVGEAETASEAALRHVVKKFRLKFNTEMLRKRLLARKKTLHNFEICEQAISELDEGKKIAILLKMGSPRVKSRP